MFLNLLPSRRIGYFLGFVVCGGLIAYALYLQYVKLIEPCPLCMLQRAAIIGMGIVFLLAALQNPRKRGAWIYACLNTVVGGLGAGVAIRHLWVQSLPPDQVPLCGPGVGFILESMPLGSAIMKMLEGSGECADKSWQFLGLTLPGWTLLFFVGMIVFSFILVKKEAAR